MDLLINATPLKYAGANENRVTMMKKLELRQLFDKESSTYTYLFYVPELKKAVIFDPVFDCHERDKKILNELDLELSYIFETHIHADHRSGAPELKKLFGGTIAVSKEGGQKGADLYLEHKQEINFADYKIQCLYTPGHTKSCMCFYFDGRVITGDVLFVRGCGRTDFQGGSSEELFHSVRNILFNLDDDVKVMPGHDYQGYPYTTIGEEKKYNPRLSLDKSLEDFIKIMNELKLGHPKKMKEVLPFNLDLNL